MAEKTESVRAKNAAPESADAAESHDTAVRQKAARASHERLPIAADGDVPPKKRKRRRGKSKRKAYQKYGRVVRKNNKVIKPRMVKPEAPHNDNQFLLEDHGGLEELDQRLKSIDQASTSTVTRTRDSSFSVDSDCEFYSSPDDEGDFLMKDFNDQYQTVQTEQLHTMSKQELIEEYLSLDSRSSQKNRDLEDTIRRLEKEMEQCNDDIGRLERENTQLRSRLAELSNANSDSEDSETDSSDSCSTSSSSQSCSSSSASEGADPGLQSGCHSSSNGHLSPTAKVV